MNDSGCIIYIWYNILLLCVHICYILQLIAGGIIIIVVWCNDYISCFSRTQL